MEAAKTTSSRNLTSSSTKSDSIAANGANNDGGCTTGKAEKVAETTSNFDFKDVRNGSSPPRDFVDLGVLEYCSDKEKSNTTTLMDNDYEKLKDKLDEYKCPICMEILVKVSRLLAIRSLKVK